MNALFFRWVIESNENCQRSRNIVPLDSFDGESRKLLTAVQKFYETTAETEALTNFQEWIESTSRNEKTKETVLTLYKAAMAVDTSSALYLSVEQSYKERYLATEIACHAEAYLNGYADDSFLAMCELLDTFREQSESGIKPVSDSLDEILDTTVAKGGLDWRLDVLNKSLGPIRKGDFIIVGARVETGKTTFLASEATHFVTQSKQPVLWINNEEDSNKVKLRLWEAAIGYSKDWIYEHKDKAEELLKPWKDKLIIVEPQYFWEVEALIAEYKPCIIVFDLLDKVAGFKADREDIIYSKMYRWARTLAKQHCPVITASQCDGEADGKKYLSMTRLDGSRTAKQKEADGIIMIGKDMENEYLRYISVPKNKLAGGVNSDEEYRHGKFEVLIDPTRARYESL